MSSGLMVLPKFCFAVLLSFLIGCAGPEQDLLSALRAKENCDQDCQLVRQQLAAISKKRQQNVVAGVAIGALVGVLSGDENSAVRGVVAGALGGYAASQGTTIGARETLLVAREMVAELQNDTAQVDVIRRGLKKLVDERQKSLSNAGENAEDNLSTLQSELRLVESAISNLKTTNTSASTFQGKIQAKAPEKQGLAAAITQHSVAVRQLEKQFQDGLAIYNRYSCGTLKGEEKDDFSEDPGPSCRYRAV